MGVGGSNGTADAPSTPQLDFLVEDVAALRPAAAPTLRFTLRIDAAGASIRSVVLDVQVQIAASRRAYAADEQELLADLFGAPERWRDTLRTLPWTRTTLVVPAFDGVTRVPLDLACTYDFEVASTRYLAALADEGAVPLELLFSGTVFHAAGDGRLQVSRIAWDREATCALPVRAWHDAVEQGFPDSAWLRLERRAFDRLAAFRARNALTSWEAVVDELLPSPATEQEDGRRAAGSDHEPPHEEREGP